MYAVVAAPDKEGPIMDLIGELVVYSEFGDFESSGLKNTFEKVLRIPLKTLILDVSINRDEDVVNVVRLYRTQRSSTRILLLAVGRMPGDQLVSSLVHHGVFDIISEENWLEKLKVVLEQPPADYSAATRWNVQEPEDGGIEAVEEGRPSFFYRFGDTAGRVFKAVKGNKQGKDTENRDDTKVCAPALLFPPVPPDFVSLDEGIGTTYYPNIRMLCEVDPIPFAILIDAGRTDLIETIKAVRREDKLLSAPVVVIGKCDTASCCAAGADECVEELGIEAIERIRARAGKLRELWSRTVRDDLTGLYKRHFLENYLAEQARRYREIGVPFTLMMCDLDYFKKINDTFGHPVGDTVLKEFAAFLLAGVRQVDVVARYGGEEFMIVFPNLEDARAIAEKLCRGWAAKELVLQDGRRIKSTFSAGLSLMGRYAQDIESLLKAADDALYQAKGAGRNRVVQVGDIVEILSESPPTKESPKATEQPVAMVSHDETLELPRLRVKKKWNQHEVKYESPGQNSKVQGIESLAGKVSISQVITVWNPNGYAKADTSLELSKSLKSMRDKIALLEFDVVNPELDELFKVPMPPMHKCGNKDPCEIGAGLITFGDKTTPDLAASFLHKYRWGIDYLPAGNKLDAMGLIMDKDELGKLIKLVIGRYDHVVIDAGTDINSEISQVAIRKSEAVIVPLSQDASTTVKKQVDWLKRLGVKVIEFYPDKEEQKQRRGLKKWLKS